MGDEDERGARLGQLPALLDLFDRGSIELWAEGEKLSILPRNYGLRPERGAKTGARKVVYDPIRHTLVVDGELPKVKTKIDTLRWCGDHELIHAGQIGLLRRLLGHKPVW